MSKWKIRFQEIRNLFFKFRLFLNMSISTIVQILDVSKSTLYRWILQGINKPINPTRIKGTNNKINNEIKSDFISYINQRSSTRVHL